MSEEAVEGIRRVIEYVVVPLLLRGRLPGSQESDEEGALPRTHVYKVREDKIVEVHEYLTLEPFDETGPSWAPFSGVAGR